MNLEFPIFLGNQMRMQLMVWPMHMPRTILKPSRKQYWPEKVWPVGYLVKKEPLLIFSYTSWKPKKSQRKNTQKAFHPSLNAYSKAMLLDSMTMPTSILRNSSMHLLFRSLPKKSVPPTSFRWRKWQEQIERCKQSLTAPFPKSRKTPFPKVRMPSPFTLHGPTQEKHFWPSTPTNPWKGPWPGTKRTFNRRKVGMR